MPSAEMHAGAAFATIVGPSETGTSPTAPDLSHQLTDLAAGLGSIRNQICQIRTMRILIRVLLALGLLLIVVSLGVVFYFNSDQYRVLLERAVADRTDYELTIAGEVELSWLPAPSLNLNDVRLSNPSETRELFSTNSVLLKLDARGLLAGRLLIRELQTQNLHINFYVRADGTSIWDASPATERTVRQTDIDSTEPVALAFERVAIDNARIDYQDLSRGLRYEIENFNLESLNPNFEGRPFEFATDFDFENDGMGEAVPVTLRSNMLIDPDNGTLNLNDTQLSITPLLLQGELSLAGLNQGLQYTGSLHAEPFDVHGLLQTLSPPEPSDAAPGAGIGEGPRLGMSLQFSGNQSEATVPSLVLTLGDTEINGNGSLRFATDLIPTSVSYELVSGDLDLTDWLPDTAGSASLRSTWSETELPFAALSSFNLLGSASLASLTVGDLSFSDISLFTTLEDGILDIETTPVSALGGILQGSLRMNSQPDTPELEIDLAMNQLNLADLAPLVAATGGFSGRLNMESVYRAGGSSIGALRDSLTGSSAFSANNSSIDITLIKQIFTAIAALSPTGESIQQWPDVVQFSELYGALTLEGGLRDDQGFRLRMDNLDISGTGGMDLEAGSFEYELHLTVLGESVTQTIPVNARYHDVPWPVICSAEFSAPLNQYCSPDFNAVRAIFAELRD